MISLESEHQTGRLLAEKLNVQTDDQALLVFYDSIKQPPGEGRPLVMNASAPLIAGIETACEALCRYSGPD